MDKPQKEIIKKLKQISAKMGHSPTKREVPNLAAKCYKHFGSFNLAKKKACLSLKNVRFCDFSERAFKIDGDLAKIASYLTFDGHLYKDLSGFYLSSKDVKNLKEFERLIKKKFGINGKYYLDNGGAGMFKTHKFIVFNKELSKKLFELGIPKGDKCIQEFNVPKWILNSKNLSKDYLKIAFLCEGSNKEEPGRTPRIQINTAKSEDILDSGLRFMNTLRQMLKKFDINTTKCYICGKRVRKKDNKISKDIKFRIDINDNNKFINEIAPVFKWG